MGAVIDRILRQPSAALWLDAHDYASVLLAGGQAPLLDVGACVAWMRNSHGLLRSDFAVLPVAAVAEAWLSAHPALREAMAAKTRTPFPLKTLLADEGLRAHLVELLAAIRTGVNGLPLVLTVPSPRHGLALAYAQAHGSADGVDIGEDEIDTAAVLLADFLREVAASGIDALLLEEAAGVPVDATALGAYSAVLNLAAHYRWDVGLRVTVADPSTDFAATGIGFLIAPPVASSIPTLQVLPDDFVDSDAVPPPGPRFLTVPAHANPERVLARLATLH